MPFICSRWPTTEFKSELNAPRFESMLSTERLMAGITMTLLFSTVMVCSTRVRVLATTTKFWSILLMYPVMLSICPVMAEKSLVRMKIR